MRKPGYKHTLLGWIPEEWEVVRLDSVIDLINGKAFKPNEWEKVGVPIIRIQNLNDPFAEFNYCNKPVEDKYYVKNGDLLFAWSGTKGVSFGVRKWENGLAVLNQHIFKVSIKGKRLLHEYTLPVLKFVQSDIEEKAHGFKSSFVHVKKHDLDRTILPLPLPKEQHRISTILDTWDKAIVKQQQLIEALQTRHRALMQQLLTGKKRLKGFKGDWKEVKLGEVCQISKGKPLSSDNVIDGEYPVIAGGKYSPYSHNNFTHENVITISASGASAGFVSFHTGRIWASDCSVIEHVKGVSNIQYLAFQAQVNQSTLFGLQLGGAQPHVFPKDIYGVNVKFHFDLEEQSAIAQVLTTSEKQIQTHRRRLAALQEQKKGLMQVLLTGKVRVKV